ncbi:MAG: hypothetical protein JST58_19525 [Bacteroidetes bacterium]|nr:hypothetical protein [Bacteroidota bacterium]
MNFFDRLSNGWKISLNCFSLLKENKQLIIFPILSGLSMILIMGSLIVGILAAAGWDTGNLSETSNTANYLVLFAFYVVNYFIVVFFNMALIHCTHLYFMGEEPTVRKGIQFSLSRIRTIFSWAVIAAIVGTILKLLQENLGSIGKIITGLVGMVWNIAVFFVVPIIAYESLGPIDAIKRSAQMMKEKWGESLGASFSFGLIHFVAIVLVAGTLGIIGLLIHPLVGITLALLGVLLVAAIMSAVHTIFVSAVYHDVTGNPVKHFNQALADNLFISK